MTAPALCSLIVSRDTAYANQLEDVLRSFDLTAATLDSAEQLAAALDEQAPDLVLIELNVLEHALDLLEHESLEGAEILIMGDEDDPELVHSAVQRGASYYFHKHTEDGFVPQLLEDLIAEAAPAGAASAEAPPPAAQFGLLRGSSRPMHRLYRTLRKVAPSKASVLLIGESGTGKELAAQTIHQMSTREQQAFVGVNCGAISPTLIESQLFGHEKGSFTGATKAHRGYFEAADGGTLFLDEITELPLDLQVKLLRVLELGVIRRLGSEQDIEVDVRIIAATNRKPEQAIADGNLREDLYYRIAQVPVWLPPLRERGNDIIALAQYFLDQLNEQYGSRSQFSPEALQKISGMKWAGNVRELSASVERAYLLSNGTIDAENITEEVVVPDDEEHHLRIPVGAPLEDAERKLIFATLRANDGNKKATAEVLGISLKTLYNRLKAYDADDAITDDADAEERDLQSAG